MPELPEVETICRGLQPHATNCRIDKLDIYQPKLRYPLEPNLSQKLQGQTILAIERRAKYLILTLSTDFLLIHFGMSGFFRVYDEKTTKAKHDHVIFQLSNKKFLHYNDTRRFGFILYFDGKDALTQYLASLAPEPLSRQFNVKYLENTLSRTKSSIKTVLMNNKVVVGVGNIYAQESLFKAGISPLRPANALSHVEAKSLLNIIKKTLNTAICQGGTTLKDFSHTDGKPGYFKQQLKVYGRANQPCFKCHTKLKEIKQSGRTTCFCPKCQH